MIPHGSVFLGLRRRLYPRSALVVMVYGLAVPKSTTVDVNVRAETVTTASLAPTVVGLMRNDIVQVAPEVGSVPPEQLSETSEKSEGLGPVRV